MNPPTWIQFRFPLISWPITSTRTSRTAATPNPGQASALYIRGPNRDRMNIRMMPPTAHIPCLRKRSKAVIPLLTCSPSAAAFAMVSTDDADSTIMSPMAVSASVAPRIM